MFINRRPGYFVFATLLCVAAASAQQSSPPTQPGNGRIYLDVVVAPKSGPPVADLQQQDFALLDNRAPQTIASFEAVSGRQAPVEIMLVIDAVNTSAPNVAYERIQIDKFLHADGGHLAYPIALAVFTDRGVEVLGNIFSMDGNALSAALEQANVGLRSVNRSSGYYGAAERIQLSLTALHQLVAGEATRPGRKIMLWVSPGWPLLSGPNTNLDSKQQEWIFADIVDLSTQFMKAHLTLYSIDALGAGESLSRGSYYKDFLKGVTKLNQVQVGDLGLPVLATQSGGLAFDLTNDIPGVLQKCLADTVPYYEISFEPPPAAQPNEYHHLEIKLAKPGLTARTRQGYYAQPLSHN
jgi:VWFA-related protein